MPLWPEYKEVLLGSALPNPLFFPSAIQHNSPALPSTPDHPSLALSSTLPLASSSTLPTISGLESNADAEGLEFREVVLTN